MADVNVTDHDLLIRLDQKLDSHIAEVRQSTTLLANSDTDHETRIRGLENSGNELQGSIRALRWIIGILTLAVGSIATFIIAFKR